MAPLSPSLWRKFFAEIYATAFMVYVGNSAAGQNILSNGAASSSFELNLAWGLAITFAIYASFNVSGGHINPSISIALRCERQLSTKHFCVYFAAQTIGAALGALAAFATYKEAIDAFLQNGKTIEDLTGFWISLPSAHTSHFGGLIDQIAATSFLGMFVAMTSHDSSPIPRAAIPALFGVNAVMLGSAFGLNAGCPLNPARELGPRITAWILGYGDLFSQNNYFIWVPIVGPLIGSVLGWLLYKLMVIGFAKTDKYGAQDKSLLQDSAV